MSIQKVEEGFQEFVSRISTREVIKNPEIRGRVKEIFAMIREIKQAVLERRPKSKVQSFKHEE